MFLTSRLQPSLEVTGHQLKNFARPNSLSYPISLPVPFLARLIRPPELFTGCSTIRHHEAQLPLWSSPCGAHDRVYSAFPQRRLQGGIIVGADEPDGFYRATLGADGQITNKTFVPLSGLTPERRALAPRAISIPINHIECSGGGMNAGDWNTAWGLFTNQCDTGWGAYIREAAWIKIGAAVAWVCNKSDHYAPCARWKYDQFVDAISVHCGGLGSGFADLDEWGKSYGRNRVDQAFCNTHA